LSIIPDGSLHKKLTAKITSISNIGEVTVRFSEKIRHLTNSSVNSSVLSINIKPPSSNGIMPYYFNWTCKGFHENQTMILQLNISNPLLVSVDVRFRALINLGQ